MNIITRYREGGFTLIESIVGLSVSGLMLAALAVFFGRGISSYRFQFEQVLTTDQAKVQMDNIIHDVRLASSIDNFNGWLISAGPNVIEVRANIDTDDDLEKVRYQVVGTDLQRTVEKVGGSPVTRRVARGVTNIADGLPLFRYFGVNGALRDGDANHTNVKKIQMELSIDVRPQENPGATVLRSDVVPRVVQSGVASPARMWRVVLDYPTDPANNGLVRVKITDPDTGQTGITTWPIFIVNGGRLQTYLGRHYVNISYQAGTVGSFLPGWYAYVGPLLIGQSGEQRYYLTDQIPLSELCTGPDIPTLLQTCAKRTLSVGAFSLEYRPIITYINNEMEDFVSDVEVTFEGSSGPTPTPGPAPVEAAYWKLDEGNSNSTADSSGHGAVGSLQQGLSSGWSSDKPVVDFTNPFALDFDGNNDHIILTNSSDLNITGDLSLTAWVKTTGTGEMTIVGGGTASTPFSGYEFAIRQGKVALRSGGDSSYAASLGTVNNNIWHHVAAVLEGGTVTFYIDGSASGTATVSAPTSYATTRRLGSAVDGTDLFDGILDDVRVYAEPLTGAEVSSLASGEDL